MKFFDTPRLTPPILDALASAALEEDRAQEDVTVRAVLPATLRVRAAIVAHDVGVAAGLPVVEAVYRVLDRRVRVRPLLRDGGRVRPGLRVVGLEGPARSILTGERSALNFIQRLSGTATLTRQCVDRVRGTGAVILHTRKTTPLLRILERWAVQAGGGRMHRGDLGAAVLIKENHLAAAGATDPAGVFELVRRARARAPAGMPVEVEVQDPQLLPVVLEAGVDIVMFDNLPLDVLRRGVRAVRAHERRAGRPVFTEASGGMTLDRIRAGARTGVDGISVGALTHSARALDYSLDILGD
jgi:nicotinate-nucleotide pyrophosphorylase (carboxylating)